MNRKFSLQIVPFNVTAVGGPCMGLSDDDPEIKDKVFCGRPSPLLLYLQLELVRPFYSICNIQSVKDI